MGNTFVAGEALLWCQEIMNGGKCFAKTQLKISKTGISLITTAIAFLVIKISRYSLREVIKWYLSVSRFVGRTLLERNSENYFLFFDKYSGSLFSPCSLRLNERKSNICRQSKHHGIQLERNLHSQTP